MVFNHLYLMNLTHEYVLYRATFCYLNVIKQSLN